MDDDEIVMKHIESIEESLRLIVIELQTTNRLKDCELDRYNELLDAITRYFRWTESIARSTE